MKIRFCTFFQSLLPFLFLLCGTDSTAQTRKADVIIRRDSIRIEALILEVEEAVVKYKKYSDQEGPTFSLGKKEIASIQYGNGEIENFHIQTELYFDESPKPVEPYRVPDDRIHDERVLRPRTGAVGALSNQQLRYNYKFYLKKTSTYKTMATVGATLGIVMTVAGAITISAANRDYNSSYGRISYTQFENRVAGGALLITAGIFGGTPLTIIGLVKKRSYSKKATATQRELNRRNEPVSIGISPGFDVQNRAAMGTLRVRF
jgi:hypothetical protein